MKILAVGDLVGESGLQKVNEIIPELVKKENIDFIIVNAENAAQGMGISEEIFYNLLNIGVNAITMGNHTWGKKDIFKFIDHKQLLIPANYNKNVPGNRYGIYNCKDKKICVISLIGRVDINILSDNPFTIVDEIINTVQNDVDIIIVDFHAEATAEKIAMGYYLDGRVNVVFGTHTHVQTADEKILENNTAFITDIGMTGPIKSVIGMNVETSIKRFITSMPERYKVAEGEAMFNGCIFEIDDKNCKTVSIKRVVIK